MAGAAQDATAARERGTTSAGAGAGAGDSGGRRRRRRYALVAIVLAVVAYATMIQSFSWNQTSHFDLVRALDHGRTTIDPYQANTGDKVLYHGHWYSARAPGLALYSLPFYEALKAVNAEALARTSAAQRGEDEMIYFVGLWGSVLPAFLLLIVVWRVAERFEPGFGAPAAIVLGLGTLVLPLATLLFSHVLSTLLAFTAFALMLRERDGPPSPKLLALAGLAIGYGVTSEYPVFFAGVVLGGYLLSRPGAFQPRALATRAGAYIGGGLVGIVPLVLYNHFAFHSWTHLAYANVPRQQKGFFGISAPSPHVLATLLFDSRGLLTISPVLIMGAIGTAIIYRRGRRAEALTIAAICVCFVGYNSGYYLPFGGGFMGPRFLTTMLPFLAPGLAVCFKRLPGPTIALAGVSVAATAIATVTHPLVGYENETVIWGRLLLHGCEALPPAPCEHKRFQPTIASAFGIGRGFGAIWPFVLAAGGALLCAAFASARSALSARALAQGVLAITAWGLFAALAPTLLGLDHRGLLDIVAAGHHTALNLKLHNGSRYPLQTLVPIAAAAAFLALALAFAWRRVQSPGGAGRSLSAARS
jgi:hypothetical protein